ncbi:hypothetical protein A2U01_0105269, partial [Trifolium medium]|nr:hypothetical protein [Trifolium medium]
VGVVHVGGGTMLEMVVLSSGGLEMYGDATAAARGQRENGEVRDRNEGCCSLFTNVSLLLT